MTILNTYTCKLIGIGAWGPGFNNWSELKDRFGNPSDEVLTTSPKPEVIPANERRRSPLAVRAAVEVCWQALQQSRMESSDVACVFGSGLGDTEITDYMCRVLTTPEKQLSPTKFHNSVHNAAAGYWTISTGCMKSANSIAAYHDTVGVCLMEAILQSLQHNEPVLISLFDIAAQETWQQIFPSEQSFAAALLICPANYPSTSCIAGLKFSFSEEGTGTPVLPNYFQTLYQDNPAAKVLPLLKAVAGKKSAILSFTTGETSYVTVEYSPADVGDTI